MILVIVDDLLFRSKISSAAKACGVTIRAATTSDAAMQRLSEERPTLVIFDLDSARTRPFDVLKHMAGDPNYASIPTLGFVSHVHTEIIREARAHGVGQVLARSAFVTSLPEIVERFAFPAPEPAE